MTKTESLLLTGLAISVAAPFLLTGCKKTVANNQEVQVKIFKRISPAESFALIQANKDNQNFIVLDIRTLKEREDKRLEDTINIDFYSKTFADDLAELDKSKTYLVYCRSSSRSEKTFEMMKKFGFTKVYDMRGGIVMWEKEGLPLVK